MRALVFTLLMCPWIRAQVDKGQIAGTVSDQSGAALSGAVITLKNAASNAERSTRSSETDAFTIMAWNLVLMALQ